MIKSMTRAIDDVDMYPVAERKDVSERFRQGVERSYAHLESLHAGRSWVFDVDQTGLFMDAEAQLRLIPRRVWQLGPIPRGDSYIYTVLYLEPEDLPEGR